MLRHESVFIVTDMKDTHQQGWQVSALVALKKMTATMLTNSKY
jgi:hypothetical protein